MMQQTLFGKLVPIASHPDDVIVCSNGTECLRSDVFADCKGGYHCTEEERDEQDVLIVTDLLNDIGKWADEYTEHPDYGASYAHLVNESSCADRIREWLDDNDDDYPEQIDRWDEFVDAVIDRVNGSWDCEAEHDRNEYAAYSGDGCCLDSFDIGEIEEQIDIMCYDELRTLHEEGRLDDILDGVNCDVYVSRSRRREKNEETGYYEPVGRETYNPYNSDHPNLFIYTNPGGQWRFVIPAERMRNLADEAIEELNDDQ